MEAIECRYCKQKGHYKNKCPKLAGKPPKQYNNQPPRNNEQRPRNNEQRPRNHERRQLNQPRPGETRADEARRMKTINPSKPKPPPKPVFENEFPQLATSSAPVPSVWGGKSFATVLTTQPPPPVEEVEEDEDSSYMKLEVLSK